MQRTLSPPIAGAVALVLALSACQRGESARPRAEDAADPGSSTAEKAETIVGDKAATEAEARRYYQALVGQYGQDYAACGPSERTLPKACDAAKDAPGGKPGTRSNVLLMLDASGSMAARIGSQTKMAAAQDALIDFTGKLADSADVALRVYGHTGDNKESGKAESCAGSELLYPFQKLDAGKFETAIRSFRPTGWTPIAASLDAAVRDFAEAPGKDGANVVYVVSDGVETCGADPVEAARKLHASAIDVVVNVIGFDVDDEAARQLEAVAKAGGGEYLSADTRTDLDRIFSERWTEAQKRYNCVWDEQQRAYNESWDKQQGRYGCLWDKAQKEYDSIWDHAQKEYNALWDQSQKEYDTRWEKLQKDDSIDSDKRNALQQAARSRREAVQVLARIKREYAQAQAKEKRDGIQRPAREERERVQDAARELREHEQGTAREERERAQNAAREEHDAGTQP